MVELQCAEGGAPAATARKRERRSAVATSAADGAARALLCAAAAELLEDEREDEDADEVGERLRVVSPAGARALRPALEDAPSLQASASEKVDWMASGSSTSNRRHMASPSGSGTAKARKIPSRRSAKSKLTMRLGERLYRSSMNVSLEIETGDGQPASLCTERSGTLINRQ